VQALRRGLPSMARTAGLTGARFEVGGEMAAAGEAIAATEASLWRVALAIAPVILVLLALFLRSLIAPFCLLAAGGGPGPGRPTARRRRWPGLTAASGRPGFPDRR
jgi:hypothetical protein